MNEHENTAKTIEGAFVCEEESGCVYAEPSASAACCADDLLSEHMIFDDECMDDERGCEPEACANLAIAHRGEEAAACYLERQGYFILERNWDCLFGEADIICESEEGDCIVFVEVKTRSGIGKGMPEEAVTPKKRSKYEKIAASYLQSHAYHETRLRFDIISILALNNGYAILKHFVNAFGAA